MEILCLPVGVQNSFVYMVWLWGSWNDFIARIPVYLQLTGRGCLWSTPLE